MGDDEASRLQKGEYQSAAGADESLSQLQVRH
jgi:hypothetical protein